MRTDLARTIAVVLLVVLVAAAIGVGGLSVLGERPADGPPVPAPRDGG